MSHPVDEFYHLGSGSGMADDYDQWLPEDLVDDMPPEVNEEQPPPDVELAGNPEQFDELPIIEEPPPEIPKPKKGRPAKETAAENRERKEEEEIERLLADHDRRNSKPAKKTPAAAKASKKSKSTVALSKEEIETHMSLLLRIDKYRTNQRFAECLAKSRLPLTNLENYSIEELEDLLVRINVVVGNRRARGGGVLGSIIVSGATLAEHAPITKQMNFRLDGYAATLAADDEFADICEQISIDYSILDNLSPEKRLVLCLGQTAMMVHGMNKFKEECIARQSNNAPTSSPVHVEVQPESKSEPIPVPAPRQSIQRSAVPVYPNSEIRDY